ncbi:DUF4283 domain-containing protein [Raphanus sativus]|nr:DUF4283 domain-containing protein [Raphanus sativus]
MASAVGFPVHSEYPDLKPYTNGVVKLRVVIELGLPRPSSIRITDKLGNSVSLPIEFLKLPPKCGGCKEFGHLKLRCPQPVRKNSYPAVGFPSFTGFLAKSPSREAEHPTAPLSLGVAHSPLSKDLAPVRVVEETPSLSPPSASVSDQCLRKLERSKSLPLRMGAGSQSASSSGWIYVAKKSEVKRKDPSPSRVITPVSAAKFAEEEEMISAAQSILRSRLAALDAGDPPDSVVVSKRLQRRKIRQRLYFLSSASDSETSPTSAASVSNGISSNFGLASGGQARLRHAHSCEA